MLHLGSFVVSFVSLIVFFFFSNPISLYLKMSLEY